MSADRYEPLPGFAELPGWLWRRTGTGLRIGLGAAVALAVVATILLVPAIRESRHERDAAARREAAAQHAAVVARMRAEQKPRFGRSHAPTRTAMAGDLTAAILTDARARVRTGELHGPILRVTCERFPKTVGAVPREVDRRYACVAVTADIARSAGGESGVIGHPYRAFLHFASGRYAFCKIAARLDPVKHPEVTTPAVCGG